MKSYHVHYHTECIDKSVRFYTRAFEEYSEAKALYEKVLMRTSTTFARLLQRTKEKVDNKVTITWETLEERIGKKKPF